MVIFIKIVIKILTIFFCCSYGLYNIAKFKKAVKDYNNLKRYGLKIDVVNLDSIKKEDVKMIIREKAKLEKNAYENLYNQCLRDIIINGVEIILKTILLILCIKYL